MVKHGKASGKESSAFLLQNERFYGQRLLPAPS